MDAGTTLVLAGTHPMAREGMKMVLEATRRMTVVGETDCPEEAVRISGRESPDILVVDFGGQGTTALRAIQMLGAEEPETNVLVITDPEQEESIDAIIEAGALGCIGKNCTAEQLVIAVDLVSSGRMRLPHRASQLVRRRIVTNRNGTEARLARLSEKERKIVALTARGLSSKQIGRQVFMTAASVDNARGRIRTKLRLRTRAELVAFADAAGLLQASEVSHPD